MLNDYTEVAAADVTALTATAVEASNRMVDGLVTGGEERTYANTLSRSTTSP